MEWWTHLWLNEGFATWVGYLAAHSLFPDWQIWIQFVESTVGLRLDALAETQPIEVDINHAGEYDDIFDAISCRKGAYIIRMLESYIGPECFLALHLARYAAGQEKGSVARFLFFQEYRAPGLICAALFVTRRFGRYAISYRKGASIIRMLQSYIGPECFQRALASYIRRYARSNAKTGDLWSVLQEESDNPVNKLVYSWTKQKDYHVVSVNIKDQTPEFEQSQFLFSGSRGEGQWIVPVTLCCSSYEACKSFLLQTKSETLDVKEFLGASISSACPWIKVNVNQTAFFRVKYDELISARLRNAIERKCLSVSDKYEKGGNSFHSSFFFKLDSGSQHTSLICCLLLIDTCRKRFLLRIS